MSNSSDMWPVLCSVCNQRVGWSKERYPAKSKIYCSEFCTHELPVTPEEVRNDAWQVLKFHEVSPIAVSKMYGSPHGLVYKVLNRLGTPVDIE